jgi:cytochrome P450
LVSVYQLDSRYIAHSHVLCRLTWALARNPEVYDNLHQELVEAFPDPTVYPDASQLRKLPYLTAVLKEGLRRWAATPLYLPRVVPEGGAVHQGKFLPAGTVSRAGLCLCDGTDP